jgi:hypothetical protein
VLLALVACKSDEVSAPATIEVMGKRLALHSAVVQGSHVVVSTGALDCTLAQQDAEVILARGELGWTLGGTLVGQIHTAKHDAATGAKLAPAGRSVELGGTLKIGPHDVALAGTLVAIDCPLP